MLVEHQANSISNNAQNHKGFKDHALRNDQGIVDQEVVLRSFNSLRLQLIVYLLILIDCLYYFKVKFFIHNFI